MSNSVSTLGEARAGDASGDSAPAGDAPAGDAPGDGWRSGGLAALRGELDRIDDSVHDLLMQRAEVVEHVARSGKPAAFRPGREAAIIRRLLGRHQGGLPPVALVRIWRELLAGTTAMQGGFSVAVPETQALAQLAREHFGALAPIRVHAGFAEALAEVAHGVAAVAVLPYPTADEPWWLTLPTHTPRLHIIARLPFWQARPAGLPATQAVVVAGAPADASGDDRSFLLGRSARGRAEITDALAAAGLPPHRLLLAGDAAGHLLAEVPGMLDEDDGRLALLGHALLDDVLLDDVLLGDVRGRPVVLGGYAVPLAGNAA